MKKISIFLIFLFAYSALLAQSNKIERTNFNNSEYFIYPERQEDDYGNSLSYWKNNIIREKYSLEKDESTDGIWIQFFKQDTTKVAKIFSLKDNELNGKYFTFFPNGNLQSEIDYSNGNVYGWWISWYENGQVSDSIEYRVDTAKNGYVSSSRIFCRRWFENGNLELVALYDSLGYKNGKWQTFYESGNIKFEVTYTNKGVNSTNVYKYKRGVIDGDLIQYYENNQIRIHLKYCMGKIIEDTYCEFYQNGQKKACGVLQDGLRIGEWTEWYDNGQTKSTGNYSNDVFVFCGFIPYAKYYEYKIDYWVYYYQNGKIMAKGSYQPSKKHVYSNCTDRVERVKCGKFTKDWEAFDVDGKEINIKELYKQSNCIANKEVFLEKIYEIEY